jgi:hypothetical protein
MSGRLARGQLSVWGAALGQPVLSLTVLSDRVKFISAQLASVIDHRSASALPGRAKIAGAEEPKITQSEINGNLGYDPAASSVSKFQTAAPQKAKSGLHWRINSAWLHDPPTRTTDCHPTAQPPNRRHVGARCQRLPSPRHSAPYPPRPTPADAVITSSRRTPTASLVSNVGSPHPRLAEDVLRLFLQAVFTGVSTTVRFNYAF